MKKGTLGETNKVGCGGMKRCRENRVVVQLKAYTEVGWWGVKKMFVGRRGGPKLFWKKERGMGRSGKRRQKKRKQFFAKKGRGPDERDDPTIRSGGGWLNRKIGREGRTGDGGKLKSYTGEKKESPERKGLGFIQGRKKGGNVEAGEVGGN